MAAVVAAGAAWSLMLSACVGTETPVGSSNVDSTNREVVPRAESVRLGEQLAFARGCSGCHSSPAGLLAGAASPISGAYGPNITPDPDTGIGSWSDADIIRLLRYGVDDEGETLCSQMPREPSLSDADAKNLVAYLRSIPAVPNESQEGMCGATAQDIVLAGKVAAMENACTSCHGGDLAGATQPVGGTMAYGPNLTPNPDTGLGGWTDEQVRRAIAEGIDDEDEPLCTVMPRFASLTDDQLDGLVAYLRSVPAVQREVTESTCDRPEVDAGTPPEDDAGAPPELDAGYTLGGGIDAGHDAGSPDAGAPDAGHPDAGTDAGVADAGTPDAGTDAGTPATCAGGELVIAQVYGAGGNSGALYKNDFVELHNRTNHVVSLDGYALQYASSTGSSWSVAAMPAGSSLAPGAFVTFALAGGANGSALPTGAVTMTPSLNLSSTTGKVALTLGVAPLTGTCPTNVVDLVGYGSTNCSRGAAAPATTVTTAVIRLDVGTGTACQSSGDNATDFQAGTPTFHQVPAPCGCP